jgi:hypothetical protein
MEKSFKMGRQRERFEETFPFFATSPGWEIELSPSLGGNADVNNVAEDDFPEINPDNTLEEP